MEENKKCRHPCMMWCPRGSSSGPDADDNFYLYDCFDCGARFRWYPKGNRIEEMPSGIGLIPAISCDYKLGGEDER